jgi:hypothetical protein
LQVYVNCCENADIAAKRAIPWAFVPCGLHEPRIIGGRVFLVLFTRMAMMRAANAEKTALTKVVKQQQRGFNGNFEVGWRAFVPNQ